MKKNYFDLAIRIAQFNNHKSYCFGAVGIRSDGVMVCARNGQSFSTKVDSVFIKNIKSHAEGRIVRKLNIGSIIYVARVTKENEVSLAKPCKGCSCIIKSKKISKVYYTIDNNYYGVWFPLEDKDYILKL